MGGPDARGGNRWAGRGELEATREQQRSSLSKLRQSVRWPGGKPPYGYLAVQHEDPSLGWALEVDRLAKPVVGRIAEDVIDGKPLTWIARELTAEGVLTPARYYASVRSGKPVPSDPGADTVRCHLHPLPGGRFGG